MEAMKSAVSKLRTLLVKTRTVRAYADIAAFFVLMTTLMALGNPTAQPRIGQEIGDWLLLAGPRETLVGEGQ